MPYSVLAKLRFFFNTNKAFLLPTALPGIRKLRALYAENNPSKLLVVGHADTTAGPKLNDPLSLDRARATVAFLKDDVDAWLAFYDKPAGDPQRWGKPEDRMMLLSIPDFGSKPKSEDAVSWFQRTRGLKIDGKCGPQTRRQLVSEYMALDGASLTEEGIEIEATAHGCGENFPVDAGGEELDAAPEDNQTDPKDRRVELFFFDPEFGIAPAPPGENSKPGSTQYPAWRKSVIQTVVIEPSDAEALRTTFVELADAHFRTNSAVVLPEGESPTKDESSGAALTAVGVFATVLRFNAEHPGRKLFVAGHTDTTADIAFNQKLSNERAQCALALLLGDRAAFQALCDARHTVSDYKQVLAWASRALDGFDCDPGRIDDNEKTAKLPVERFQAAYNRNKATLGLPPFTPDLQVDGDVGPLTWGAIFDCYEFALQQELGEDATGLATLRQQLAFVDDDRKALGFSEYFPIEELGVDNYRSQANRRVEFIFYERGEEPDLEHAEADPETSEVYLPGVYVREPLQLMVSAKPWFASFDGPKVHADEARLLNLVAPGLPSGTPMTFTVSSSGVAIATLQGVSGTDAASIPFGAWDAPDDVPFVGDLNAGQEFPVVTYDFEVEGGGRVASSRAPVTYEDVIRLQLTLEQDDDVEILANQPYVVNTLWGRRRGQTDDQGMLIETGLPPGGASVVLRDRYLLDSEPLPFGWDKDES